jgi:hypothetical protein
MLKSVTYLVTAQNRSHVLPRVVMLLDRLAVPIQRLSLERSGKSPPLALLLEAEISAYQAERMAVNLMKLISVTSVEIDHRLRYRFNKQNKHQRRIL